MHVVADENIPGLDTLLPEGVTLQRVPGRELDPAMLAGADALLVRSVTRVDAALLADSPVRFVGSATSGLEHVDQAYLASADIAFANAPGANANAVVEYVLTAVAAVEDYLERLLDGGRVGIIGYGHIGHALAQRLRLLGIGCAVYDPWLPREGRRDAAEFEEVMACDVISCHAELTTREPYPSLHLLDAQALAGLHGRQLLINASRGAVIDNKALLARCTAADAPAVVLDVWEGEPEIDARLLDRVAIGTPHIAGYSVEGKLRGSAMLVTELAAHMGETGAHDSTLYRHTLLADSSAIAAVLATNYDIWRDDAALRGVVNDVDSASGFDRLRREYPDRHELLGASLTVPGATPEERDLLAALGCSVEIVV
ncbi:MAG: 4-phosphoerythronate dehydrogenase [Halioglobus sp.]|nr:4-phosphoerythronate dehydrogenase [Halioglobus sp.]